MTNYSKTKIYKIESHLGDKIYIGSTAKEYLSQRFQQHKNDYKRWKLGKGHNITSFNIFELYGINNCSIALIEAYSCNSIDEKNAREGHFIKTLQCVNKIVLGRTPKEYYIDNKEARIEYQKKYDDLHKDLKKAYYQQKKFKNLKIRTSEPIAIEEEIEAIITA
jgi:hypothetical protein